MEVVINHKEEILVVALAVSEILALIPSIKANSIFQLVVGWLKGQKK